VQDREAWVVPAEPGETAEVAAFLISAVEPEANANRVATLTRLVAMQDYTRAELLLALRKLPTMNAYGQGFRLDLLHQLVEESRNVRRIIGHPMDGRDGAKPRKLTERQMFDACQTYPEHFRTDDFRVCDYDVQNRPFYVYAPDAPPQHEPTPELEDRTPPARLDAGTGGPVSLSALVKRDAENGRAA